MTWGRGGGRTRPQGILARHADVRRRWCSDPFRIARLLGWSDRLARLTRDNGILLVIRFTPVLESQQAESLDLLEEQLGTLERDFPDIVVSRPLVLEYEPACFGEPRHCNARGAERFTALVAEEIAPLLAGLGDNAGGRDGQQRRASAR